MERWKVYIHKFPNKKVYIGITGKDAKLRWGRGSGYSYNKRMFNAILKYGWDNIEHIILYDNLTKEEAEKKEVQLINEYKSNNQQFGYNIQNGGNATGKMAESSKEKIRIARIGKKQSDEFCQMMKNIHKGNKYHLNKKATEETRLKMALSHMGAKAYNAKKINQFTLSGDFVKKWDCIMDIQRELGFLNNAIVQCLKGKTKKSYNYIWRYADE